MPRVDARKTVIVDISVVKDIPTVMYQFPILDRPPRQVARLYGGGDALVLARLIDDHARRVGATTLMIDSGPAGEAIVGFLARTRNFQIIETTGLQSSED